MLRLRSKSPKLWPGCLELRLAHDLAQKTVESGSLIFGVAHVKHTPIVANNFA